MVALFEVHAASKDLRALARNGPGTPHGLMATEVPTIQAVAAGLVRQADDHALDDEAAVVQWSRSAAPFEHASKLEPYVGSVSEMGPALLAYLRMRCGADAIEPDLRVRDALNTFGFRVPNDPHAILVVAHAAADALEVPLLVLDQLLWWSTPPKP